ncbi:MAG: cell division protein ZapA [Burkholderiaceae bacterium]|jgi:cell division protein ZapA
MSTAVDVTIMGQPYKLACNEGEEQALMQAVTYLDERMCAIRDAGKVRGNDRIAVMAGLGMAAELLASSTAQSPIAEQTVSQVREKINMMNKLIDAALTPQEKLF